MTHILVSVERIPWQWIAFFTGVALLIVLLLVKKLDSNSFIFFYGGEYGSVGRALAQGRGFSDPFSVGSGPTAWVAPLLPAIMGAVFSLTSLKITATYWILLFIKIISLALGAGLIWAVLQKSNRGIAPLGYFWMGILCYVHNIELFSLYHDEWLIFLVISLAFWAWQQRAKISGRIALMAAFSAAALGNPILWGALVIVTLVFNRNGSADSGETDRGRSDNRAAAFARDSFWMAVGLSCVLIAGWTARNWVQVGMFAPVKSNAGYELFQAQVASRSGVPDSSTFARHPIIRTSLENQAYRSLGEREFIRARRDSALQSMLADPTDYARKVAHRFINAFLFTASPANTAVIDGAIGSSDRERLRKAGFVAYRNDQVVWLDLDDLEKDLIRVLPSLGLDDPQLVGDNWRTMSEGHYWYRFSWERILGGCLSGGMPWIALCIAFLMRRRAAIIPGAGWAGLFVFVYLMPYVLISHYLRYQVPLLGMHAVLLTAGTIALLSARQQEPGGSAQPEG